MQNQKNHHSHFQDFSSPTGLNKRSLGLFLDSLSYLTLTQSGYLRKKIPSNIKLFSTIEILVFCNMIRGSKIVAKQDWLNNNTDNHGKKISTWCSFKATSTLSCNICFSNIEIGEKGYQAVKSHYLTKKHEENLKKKTPRPPWVSATPSLLHALRLHLHCNLWRSRRKFQQQKPKFYGASSPCFRIFPAKLQETSTGYSRQCFRKIQRLRNSPSRTRSNAIWSLMGWASFIATNCWKTFQMSFSLLASTRPPTTLVKKNSK